MGYQRTIPKKEGESKRNNSGGARESLSVIGDLQHPALYLQRKAGNQAALHLLRSSGGHVGVQKKCAGCGNCPECAEEEELIQRKPFDSTPSPLIQRQGKEREAAEPSSTILIVEDSAPHLDPGQMRKSEFLDQLHSSVCGAAEEALAGTMWSAMGCPYIDRWFSHYSGQNSQHIERALHKYAPEAAGVGSAREYIPIVTQRLRRGIEQWRETGEVTGVPEELTRGGEMPGVSAGTLISGIVGGALSAIGNAVSGLVSGVGNAISGIGRALFKEREGGAREAADPAAIQSQLGSGQPMDGGMRAGMEAAFGADFSGVRIHTGAKAQELNKGLNARAFTVGRDVAFGSGEYQPGTLVGDALIAHELAHVVQQDWAGSSSGPKTKGGADYGALEEDADISAVGAVASLWGGAKGSLADIGRRAAPRLRSGLRLSSCGGEAAQKSSPEAAPGNKPTRLIDVPELRGTMAKMWTNSIAEGVVVREYSITVVRDKRTGRVTKVDSWVGKEIRPGEPAETKICLRPGFKLEPYEEVWGSVHTHPLLLGEAPAEPNDGDQETVRNILSSKDAIANCGTEHYVIARDDNIYQFDGKSYRVAAKRKATIGV